MVLFSMLYNVLLTFESVPKRLSKWHELSNKENGTFSRCMQSRDIARSLCVLIEKSPSIRPSLANFFIWKKKIDVIEFPSQFWRSSFTFL